MNMSHAVRTYHMVPQPGAKHKHAVRKVKTFSRLYLPTAVIFLCAVADSGLGLCLDILLDAIY